MSSITCGSYTLSPFSFIKFPEPWGEGFVGDILCRIECPKTCYSLHIVWMGVSVTIYFSNEISHNRPCVLTLSQDKERVTKDTLTTQLLLTLQANKIQYFKVSLSISLPKLKILLSKCLRRNLRIKSHVRVYGTRSSSSFIFQKGKFQSWNIWLYLLYYCHWWTITILYHSKTSVFQHCAYNRQGEWWKFLFSSNLLLKQCFD